MAHGAPDDSDVLKEQDLYRVDDMAELAARLGSIVTYRRSGQVVYLDDFANGLNHWLVHTFLAGDAVTLQNLRTRSRGACPRFNVAAGGAAIAEIASRFPVWGAEHVSLQGEMCLNPEPHWAFLDIQYHILTGWYWFRLVYDIPTGSLLYLDATGAYIVLSTSLNLAQDGSAFYSAKLTIDLAAACYVRISVGQAIFEMPGVPGYLTVIASNDYVDVAAGFTGRLAGAGFGYWDNIIITRGEI